MSGPRSVTSGTCAVNGQHPPGSKYAPECPLLSRPRRSEAARAREQRKRARTMTGAQPASPGASTARTAASEGTGEADMSAGLFLSHEEDR
jgi:hypothetical protein